MLILTELMEILMHIDPVDVVREEHGHLVVLGMPESLVTRAFSKLADQVVLQEPY